MYAHVHVCVHVYVYVYMYIYVYFIRIYVSICICVHVYVHVYMYVYMCTCICICICVCVCVCVCVCICTCTWTLCHEPSVHVSLSLPRALPLGKCCADARPWPRSQRGTFLTLSGSRCFPNGRSADACTVHANIVIKPPSDRIPELCA